MTKEIAPIGRRQLNRAGFGELPAIITDTGEKAARRFIEFFTANIRNKNIRATERSALVCSASVWLAG